MNPRTHAHQSIAEAREFGTFRTLVTCDPIQFEIDGTAISINECWLEQMLEMDFLYSPWRKTDTYFLCFQSNTCLDHQVNAWPEGLSSRMTGIARTGPDPLEQNGGPWVYVYRLHYEEVIKEQASVSINRLPDEVNQTGQILESIQFSWEPLKERFWIFEIFYLLFYWTFAICFYFLVIAPIFWLSVPVHLFNRKINLHSLLCRIQHWLYKLH